MNQFGLLRVFGYSIRVIFTVVTLIALSAGAVQSQKMDSVLLSMQRSIHYLNHSIRQDGSFLYRINLNPEVIVNEKYNILRHAGTIYAMASYCSVYPDSLLETQILLATDFLLGQTNKHPENDSSMKAVWSDPAINHSRRLLEAKLGGTGLGLVALLSVDKIHPGYTPLMDLKALGKFILYMQKKNGDFHSKYIPQEGGLQNNWKSLYYPGEAALGLIMLYEKEQSEIWLESAFRALSFLAESRKGQKDVPADHWALLATGRLLDHSNLLTEDQKNLLFNHAIQICRSILRDQLKYHQISRIAGGFTKDGRTTPASIRLEGLLAIYPHLTEDSGLKGETGKAIELGIDFLLEAQIKNETHAGAYPRAITLIPSTVRDAKKFNDRAGEIRIDYVQHALSALLMYHLQFSENP
jgi:hypothetical protein